MITSGSLFGLTSGFFLTNRHTFKKEMTSQLMELYIAAKSNFSFPPLGVNKRTKLRALLIPTFLKKLVISFCLCIGFLYFSPASLKYFRSWSMYIHEINIKYSVLQNQCWKRFATCWEFSFYSWLWISQSWLKIVISSLIFYFLCA